MPRDRDRRETELLRRVDPLVGHPRGAASGSTAIVSDPGVTEKAGWSVGGRSRKYKITVPHALVAGDLTGYKLYLNGACFPASFWAAAQETGDDVVFYASDARTQLAHDMPHFTAAGQACEVHVGLTETLSSTTDTVLYACVGNATATDQRNPTGVWDAGYVGVWHMPGGTGNAADSTTHGLTATDSVSQTGGSGYLYATGGQQFDNNDYLNVADNALLDLTGAVTIEGWYNPTSAAGAIQFLSLRNATYYLSIGSTDAKLYGYVVQGTANKLSYSTANFVQNGWQHLAMTWDRTDGVRKVKLYRNGVAPTYGGQTAALDADIDNTNQPFRIGYSSSSLVGYVDEVRLSNVARSANWLLTQYRNQSSPQTFVTVTEVLPYEYCPWFAYGRVGFGAGRLR